MQHLALLNPAQREAALHKSGPLLIVAGAGAGKTKTITHRIINLIKDGVEPHKILAVTFTNKAAKEMRERLLTLLDSQGIVDASLPPFVSTFHSLGVYIIKENARLLGLTRHFTILDESDSHGLIKEALKELGLDPKQYDPRKIKGIISREKGKFTNIANYIERANDPTHEGSSDFARAVAEIWNIYEKKKSKENSLDFDDLLLKSVKLLEDNKEIRKNYQDRWQYIHIDEYQDTNQVQYLMSRLLSETHKNICVVGDADQNIYSWRGANLKNILNFEKDYPNAKIILLEENYRSTKNILEAANEIIKKNKYRPDKNLFTKNETGEKITLYEAMDETDEADFIATKILEILDRGPSIALERLGSATARARGIFQQENIRAVQSNARAEEKSESVLSEVAVLYRANFQSRVLEEAMLRYNIPYQVLGVKFFERKEIKDTLAYIRAALNPESLSDIKRIINFPARGIGKVTLAKIFAGERETLPIKVRLKIDSFYNLLEEIRNKIEDTKAGEVIKFVVKRSGIEEELKQGGEEELERLENIKELATLALKYDNLEGSLGVEKLLEDAALASDQDSILISEEKKEKKDAIRLMTVHASKGLEFKHVFITGLEEGLFPHERQGDTKRGEDAEEERRLFYVALTRAREKLFLSYANYRTIFGSRQMNMPSEFLADIPADLIDKDGGNPNIKTIYI